MYPVLGKKWGTQNRPSCSVIPDKSERLVGASTALSQGFTNSRRRTTVFCVFDEYLCYNGLHIRFLLFLKRALFRRFTGTAIFRCKPHTSGLENS